MDQNHWNCKGINRTLRDSYEEMSKTLEEINFVKTNAIKQIGDNNDIVGVKLHYAHSSSIAK